MKEKFQLNIFRKFMLSYLLFLVIALLSGIISYRVSEEVITDSSKTTSLMMLNQSKDFVDQLMLGIQNLSKEISTNEDIANYVNGGSEEQDIYNTWKAWKSLAPYHFSNNIIQNFYLYTKSNDVLLTPQGAYVRPDDYYLHNRYKEMNALAWRQDVLDSLHQDEILDSMPYENNTQQTNVITYMDTIAFSHNTATLVVLIDEREVQKLLGRNMLEYGGWVDLSDENGHSIASYGNMPNLSDREPAAYSSKDTLIIQTKSDFNGWTYTAGLSKAKVMSKADYVRNVMLILLLMTTIVGLIIAFLFSYRNSAPLNEIASLLKEAFDAGGYTGKNGFDFLRGNVTKLISNYHALGEEMSKQLPVLREAYISRLLSGKLTESEIQYAHEQLRIRLQGQSGYVVLVVIQSTQPADQKESLPHMNISRVIVRKVLEEILHEDIAASEEQVNQYAFIWTTGKPLEEDKEYLNTALDKLVTVLSGQYDLLPQIYVGGAFRSLDDIYRSHYEAKQAMEQALSSASRILWYEQLPTELGSLYYPIDVEMRLMSAVKSGGTAEIGTLLDRIFEENLKVRQVNGEMFKQLIFEMKGTVYKIISQSPKTDQTAKLLDDVQAINPCDALVNVTNEMKRSFMKLCEIVASGRINEETVTEQILKFLMDHYASSQLSLTLAAEHVQLPEKQVSLLFKKQLGETFSGYLERLRIEKAIVLLSEGTHMVEEIAEKAGYNSAHAFRRAFKRVTGASPSMYRTISHDEVEYR